MFVTITDTIWKNTLFNRLVESDIIIPTTTVTQTEYINPREFYVGFGLNGTTKQFNYVGGSILYRNKKETSIWIRYWIKRPVPTNNLYSVSLEIGKEMSKNIKELIREEYVKCAKNPVYFFKKYCYIQHPKRGKILFDLYPFQEDVMGELDKHRYNVILKSRQLGISTLSAGYSLWMMLFHDDKNILVIATKQEVAKNLVTKVRYMHESLPSG